MENQPDVTAMKTEDIINQLRSDMEKTIKKQLSNTIEPTKV